MSGQRDKRRGSTGISGRGERGTRCVGAQRHYSWVLKAAETTVFTPHGRVKMKAWQCVSLLACACFLYQADGRKSKWRNFGIV